MDTLTVIYKNLQNNLSLLFQEFLRQTDIKDSAIIKQIDIIKTLMSDNKQLNERFDSLILANKVLDSLIAEKNAKFNPKSLVPGWVQFEKGDSRKGHLFLWSQVVFIPSAIVSWGQYGKHKRLSETPSRNQRVYERNRDVCLALGIATTALAVGFYVWNIIDGNTSKKRESNMTFLPYIDPSKQGVALVLNF
jgi:hypothetical protein